MSPEALLASAETIDGIAVAQREHTLLVAFDKPDRLNALSSTMLRRLEALFLNVRDDPSVRAIVITGKGKAFCSGADVSNLGEGRTIEDDYDNPAPMPLFTPRHAGVYKPVICAVNGMCASAGLHFVADSDIVIASESAKFTDTHVDVGQVTAIEPIGLTRRIPLGPVLRMVILGRAERLTAEQALAIHMISEILPEDRLLERALELADIAASVSPTALEISLKAIWGSFDLPLHEAYDKGWVELVRHRRHPDAKEGPKAFFEKRKPIWQ